MGVGVASGRVGPLSLQATPIHCDDVLASGSGSELFSWVKHVYIFRDYGGSSLLKMASQNGFACAYN